MSVLFDLEEIPVQRNESFEARRFGKLFYSKAFMETSPEALSKLYSKIIPLEVKYDLAREIFEVTAMCEDFEPTEPGHALPYYAVYFKVVKRKLAKNGKNKAYIIAFEKIEV